eukprot:2179117-Rhodomonas_salina.1
MLLCDVRYCYSVCDVRYCCSACDVRYCQSVCDPARIFFLLTADAMSGTAVTYVAYGTAVANVACGTAMWYCHSVRHVRD